MNILHISSNYPPEIGGPAASVPYLAQELKKRGHNISVLTKDIKNRPSFEVLDEIATYRSIRVPGYYYNPPIAAIKSLAMGVKARKIIEKEKIGIIHSHDINVSAIAGIVGTKFKDIKKITKLPGDLAWELLSLTRWRGESPQEFFENGGLLVDLVERVQRVICNQYDQVIVPSKYVKKDLIKYCGFENSRIIKIPNAINRIQYSEQKINKLKNELLGKNQYTIITACRMVPWKGLRYLIEAFKELPEDIGLVLIGDGPIRGRMEKEAKGLNIRFLGKIPHSEVQAYIKASDLYVLPSIYEPFGIALLDCLVTQTPVIATEVGGIPEVVTHKKTGLLINAGDPEAIRESVLGLLSDEERYEKIRENQEKEYKKYLWENMIDKYIKAYVRLLDQ